MKKHFPNHNEEFLRTRTSKQQQPDSLNLACTWGPKISLIDEASLLSWPQIMDMCNRRIQTKLGPHLGCSAWLNLKPKVMMFSELKHWSPIRSFLLVTSWLMLARNQGHQGHPRPIGPQLYKQARFCTNRWQWNLIMIASTLETLQDALHCLLYGMLGAVLPMLAERNGYKLLSARRESPQPSYVAIARLEVIIPRLISIKTIPLIHGHDFS